MRMSKSLTRFVFVQVKKQQETHKTNIRVRRYPLSSRAVVCTCEFEVADLVRRDDTEAIISLGGEVNFPLGVQGCGAYKDDLLFLDPFGVVLANVVVEFAHPLLAAVVCVVCDYLGERA